MIKRILSKKFLIYKTYRNKIVSDKYKAGTKRSLSESS